MEDDSCIRIEPSDIEAFRKSIAEWETRGSEAQREGDLSMASAYAKDGKELRAIQTLIEAGRYKAVARSIERLDTIVRDQIPPSLYAAVMRVDVKPGKPQVKTKSAKSPDERLEDTAKTLIDLLGDETAAAIAAKCQVTYGRHPADIESARLAQVIIKTMGVKRYNALEVL